MRAANVWRAGVAVLQEVTWQLNRGECWVVHGANGSGKSTLLGALHGEFGVDDRGSLWRRGLADGMPLEGFQRGVGRVAPELQAALPRHLGALECVVGGLRNSHGIDAGVTAGERRQARRALRRVGALSLAARALHELSYGQMRRVLFARALVRDPAILLLDEPYAGLDAGTRAQLRALIESWMARGRTLVIATHHRDEWPQAATHELLLVGGKVRRCGPLRSQVTSPVR
jgi:molybdate transport system ATP-binding protein